jgi:hypothetical protein
MRRPLLLVAAVAALAATALVLAEPAVTVKQVELKQNPGVDFKTVTTVPAGTSVTLLKREGAWVELQSGKGTGWAKVFDIRLAPAPAGKGSGKSGGAAANLDAETLAKATPNPQEFNLLVTYSSTKEQAQAFAKAGKLAARKVERNQ